jgi:probable HAF family extracellular repeat protein
MSRLRIAAILSVLLVLSGAVLPPAHSVDAAEPPRTSVQAVRISDLGTLGGDYSEAFAINALGQVVGASTTASGERHAFLWTAGHMRDLGTLGGTSSIARDINLRGQIVGSSTTADGQDHAFIWTPLGGMRDLGTLGRPRSYAYGINDRGQVVGYTAALTSDPPFTRIGHAAFIWTVLGGMHDLRAPDDQWSEAWDINLFGQVVGSRGGRAFRWTTKDGMQDLGVPDGRARSYANSINDRGQVAGWSEGLSPTLEPRHILTWTAAAGPRDVVATPELDATGQDINDRGQLIGETPGGPVYWTQRDGLLPLTLASRGGAAYINAINIRGQLAGWSSNAAGEQHATVWTLGG